MNTVVIDPLHKAFSAIGLGCVTFGREIDEKASFGLMDHALERGVTFFDTAASYGDGASELILGAWLAARKAASEQLIIATKVQPPYTREHIMASLDGSRRRLGLDCVDVLYMHRWDDALLTSAVMEALDQLVRGGHVRMLGLSNANTAQLRLLRTRQHDRGLADIRSIQNNRNLAVDEVGQPLTDLCTAEQLALVTYSPLGAGFLTGKYREGLPGQTRFSIVPGHRDVYFHPAVLQRLGLLQALATKTGYSPVQLALAWALHQPGTTSVLVGGRDSKHLDQAFEALSFNDPEILDKLMA